MSTKSVRIVRAVLGALGILLLAGFLYLGVWLYDPFLEGGALHVEWLILFLLVTILGGVLSAFLHPLFHELGHVMFGSMVGLRLISFRVWFIAAEREDRGFKLRFCKEGGGQTAMLPKSTEGIRRKMIIYAMGGLFGTLLYALLSAVVIRIAPLAPFWAYALLGVGAVVGVVQFFSNLIPSEGEEPTDGERILSLWKKTPSSKLMLAVVCAEGELLIGKRPREISPKFLFDLPVVAEDDFNYIALLSVRAAYYFDNGEFAALSKEYARIESLLDYVGEENRLTLRAELLFYALLRGDKQGVLRHKEVIGPLKLAKTTLSYRVRAAYELYEEENLPVAHILLNRYQKAVESVSIPGIRVWEEDLARTLLSALTEKEGEAIDRLDRLQKEKTAVWGNH